MRTRAVLWWTTLTVLVAVILGWSTWLNLHSSLRLDEAQSVWVITKTIPGILSYIANDVHVPLYFVLLHFWTQIFGTGVVAIRMLSVLFLVLSVPVVFTLAKEAANRKVAAITTYFFCLSPFLSWYGTEARMYTLLVLLSALSSLQFLRMLRSHFTGHRISYTFWTLLGVYSHYFFMILVALQAVYVFVSIWKKRQSSITSGTEYSWWQPLQRYFVCLVIVVLSLIPWMYFTLHQGGNSNSRPLLTPPSSYSILLLFVQLLTGFQPTVIENSLISIWPLLLVGLFLTFGRPQGSWFRHLSYFLLVVLGSTIVALLVSFTVQPIFVARYLIFITPALFYILAVLLEHFDEKTYKAIVILIFMSTMWLQYQQLTSPDISERENYAGASTYLTTTASSQDIITASSPFTVYPLEYYYRGEARIDTIPEWNRYAAGGIPAYSEAELEKQIEIYKKNYQKLFVVLSYDQGYEDKIIQYLDTHLELKDTIVFSPGQQIRTYQLRYDSL